MIHRMLYRALQNGLAMFKDDPSLYADLFRGLMGLDEKETEAVRRFFTPGPPPIEHAFSPSSAKLPCYVIALGSEQQNGFVLGNTAGLYAPPTVAAGQQKPLFTTVWRHNYMVMCYAQQPDLVVYMYELAKCALFFQLNALMRQGCNEIQLSGQDLQPEGEDRAPDRLFNRSLQFSCSREFRLFAKDDVTRRFAVDGTYIAGGSNSSGGQVAAKIQTTTPPVR